MDDIISTPTPGVTITLTPVSTVTGTNEAGRRMTTVYYAGSAHMPISPVLWVAFGVVAALAVTVLVLFVKDWRGRHSPVERVEAETRHVIDGIHRRYALAREQADRVAKTGSWRDW